MPRTASPTGFSIAQLQKLVQSRQTEMARLSRNRDKLLKKLDAVEAKLAAISGGAGGRGRGGAGGGTRARNEVSLQDTIHQILSKAGGPMSVGDILAKVTATGYRSNSANFRGIVNQTLIKDKRFNSASRGMYQVKK
jgi:hypothetical protein